MTIARQRSRQTMLAPHDDSVTTMFRRIEAVSTSFGEALMPVRRTTTTARGLVVACGLLVTAIVVVGLYIGLPLVLVSRDVLHALPNALAVTVGVLLLVATGIATVLIKTTPTSTADQVVEREARFRHVPEGRPAAVDGTPDGPATTLIPRVIDLQTATVALPRVRAAITVETPTMALPVVNPPTVVIPLQRRAVRQPRGELYVPNHRRYSFVGANRS